MDVINSIRKALVPVAVAGALAVLALVGITGEMTVREALTLLVTALLTWLVPNISKRVGEK